MSYDANYFKNLNEKYSKMQKKMMNSTHLFNKDFSYRPSLPSLDEFAIFKPQDTEQSGRNLIARSSAPFSPLESMTRPRHLAHLKQSLVSRAQMRFKILPSAHKLEMPAISHRIETTKPKKRVQLP